MKRIGIDARYLLSPQRGIPLYVVRLCQLLPALRREYQFYYFINKGYEHNDKPENYQSLLDQLSLNNYNLRIINCSHDAEILWEQVYLPRLIKEHKIDILHMPGNRTCFFPTIPTAITVHDILELMYMDNGYFKKLLLGNEPIKLKLYKLRRDIYIWANYRYAFNKASKIITVSRYSAADINKYLRIPNFNIIPIHHGVDSEFFLSDSSDFNNMKSRKNVLMLGGDVYHKNAEGAITAWARVNKEIRLKYPLKVIGFCGTDKSPLIKSINTCGLSDEVEVVGWVDHDALIQNMQQAVLFLYLSRYEGFGFPPLHAMACGTPVVASNVTSIPEVLGNVGLKYSPDDHDNIAKGIELILRNEQIWNEQSRAGIERSLDFSWEQSAKEHLNVYQELLR